MEICEVCTDIRDSIIGGVHIIFLGDRGVQDIIAVRKPKCLIEVYLVFGSIDVKSFAVLFFSTLWGKIRSFLISVRVNTAGLLLYHTLNSCIEFCIYLLPGTVEICF